MNEKINELIELRDHLAELSVLVGGLLDGIKHNSISETTDRYRKLCAIDDESYDYEVLVTGRVRDIMDDFFEWCIYDGDQKQDETDDFLYYGK